MKVAIPGFAQLAAVCGSVDRDNVLWLTGKHYARQKPLSYHAQHLPRDVFWYADPAGANERCELRCANLKVVPGAGGSLACCGGGDVGEGDA